jgi:hypothetical protein
MWFCVNKQNRPHLFQVCTQSDSSGLTKFNLDWEVKQYRLNHMYHFQLIKLQSYKLFELSAQVNASHRLALSTDCNITDLDEEEIVHRLH